MASILKSDKGFKLIEVSLSETTKFGGIGICDSCNGSDFKGVLICVLNRWYCTECFNKWHETANYYPEDSRIEERNFNHYSTVLGI